MTTPKDRDQAGVMLRPDDRENLDAVIAALPELAPHLPRTNGNALRVALRIAAREARRVSKRRAKRAQGIAA